MEKTCEFCGAPRPIVYCQPDGAFLCLSCDAKVHSANALSSRHSRILLCDSCRYSQALVRCMDHLMLLCKNCDSRLHKGVTQHRKLIISSFTGCPTAKHFAALWGVDADELNEFSARGVPGSGSGSGPGPGPCMSTNMTGVGLKSLGSVAKANDSSAEHGSSSRNRQYNCKTQSNYQKDQKNCLIMQQILDLKKLQLTETDGHLPVQQHHGDPDDSSSASGGQGIHNKGLDQQLKDLDYLNNVRSHEDSDKMLQGDRFPSPTSQLNQSSNPSSVEDPFWQDKFPADNSQFWTQHIQDLGVCEELGSFDDFNIPDVDVSFRNFEDLFNNDTCLAQPLLEDHDLMWSDIEKATRQGTSRTSFISAYEESYAYDNIANTLCINLQNANKIKSSNSASFSSSRLSVESSGSECQDSGNSGSFVRGERLCNIDESHGTEAGGGECTTRQSKEGKKTRLHGRQTLLSPRKSKAGVHKRSKSRCTNIEGYESDPANSARSY